MCTGMRSCHLRIKYYVEFSFKLFPYKSIFIIYFLLLFGWWWMKISVGRIPLFIHSNLFQGRLGGAISGSFSIFRNWGAIRFELCLKWLKGITIRINKVGLLYVAHVYVMWYSFFSFIPFISFNKRAFRRGKNI